MHFSNLVGVITGCLFLVLAIGFASDNPATFINLPGLLIVLGGTLTAILVSFPYRDALAAFKQIKVITEPLHASLQDDIAHIMKFAKLWFRNQYNQIDSELERMDDTFMQKGLQMVRDKQPPEDVMALLHLENIPVPGQRNRGDQRVPVHGDLRTCLWHGGIAGGPRQYAA